MAAAVVKHAGARHVVITDTNDYRLELAGKLGADTTLSIKSGRSISDVQAELGMKEGFDVGLEMSGSASALTEMVNNMCHGGKIAILGIPSGSAQFDWQKVIFNMLTLKGIYGREMYETWYKMTVMLESGLNIKPVITHRFHFTEFEKGFDVMIKGECGKVVLSWD
jgi:threonine 3-dehydrogenase